MVDDNRLNFAKVRPRLQRHPVPAHGTSFEAYISLSHAALVLTVGTLVLCTELPTFALWRTPQLERWFKTTAARTSIAQTLLFSISILYFSFDMLLTVWKWSRSKYPENLAIGNVLHHGVSMMGLSVSIVSGHDGTIALIGILICELSNPPRFLAQLQQQRHIEEAAGALQSSKKIDDDVLSFIRSRMYALSAPASSSSTCSHRTHTRRIGGGGGGKANSRSRTTSNVHFLLEEQLMVVHCIAFVMSRLFCAHFFTAFVIPFSHNFTTKLSVFLTLAISCGSGMFYVVRGSKKNLLQPSHLSLL